VTGWSRVLLTSAEQSCSRTGTLASRLVSRTGTLASRLISRTGTLGSRLISRTGKLGTRLISQTGKLASRHLSRVGRVANRIVSRTGTLGMRSFNRTSNLTFNRREWSSMMEPVNTYITSLFLGTPFVSQPCIVDCEPLPTWAFEPRYRTGNAIAPKVKKRWILHHDPSPRGVASNGLPLSRSRSAAARTAWITTGATTRAASRTSQSSQLGSRVGGEVLVSVLSRMASSRSIPWRAS
jgi:hypothetical protein